MKKVYFLVLLFCFFSTNTYPFWIWSPKTQKWKNPANSPLATPYLQYKEAIKLFERDNFKDAHREFKKILIHYPDSKEAAEAQYYLGRCLEKLDKPYEAFLEYQKLIDSYPNSQRISEVVEREYNIGERFLNREYKKWLGLSVYDFVEHPSVQIFSRIVEKLPYSEYAPRAQYKLGMIFMQLSHYDEAREAFQKVVDNYSDSEWAAPSKYQLAIATSKAFSGADYDSSYLKEATSRLDQFIKDHPQAKISSSAQEQLEELRNQEAKKHFEIAQFYENQDKYRSATLYYSKVIKNYPDSDYYDISFERIQELEGLIRANTTKKELRRKEKRQDKESKIRAKQRIKDKKIEAKQETKEKKVEFKREKREAKLRRIEEKREAKIKRKEDKKAKKEALCQEKRDKKEAIKAEKKASKQEEKARKKTVKEEKREAKLKRKLEKKKAKIKRKEDKRETKPQINHRKKIRKEALRQEKIKKRADYAKKKIERKRQRRKEKEELVEKKKRAKQARRKRKLKDRQEKREAKLKIKQAKVEAKLKRKEEKIRKKQLKKEGKIMEEKNE